MKKTKGFELIDKRGLRLVKQPRVNVGISNLPLMMYVNVLDFKKGILKAEIDNQSGYTMSYNKGYAVNRIENRQYKEIVNALREEKEEIKDLEKREILIDLSSYKLTAGLYMLVLADNRVEFELKK